MGPNRAPNQAFQFSGVGHRVHSLSLYDECPPTSDVEGVLVFDKRPCFLLVLDVIAYSRSELKPSTAG